MQYEQRHTVAVEHNNCLLKWVNPKTSVPISNEPSLNEAKRTERKSVHLTPLKKWMTKSMTLPVEEWVKGMNTCDRLQQYAKKHREETDDK